VNSVGFSGVVPVTSDGVRMTPGKRTSWNKGVSGPPPPNKGKKTGRNKGLATRSPEEI
jgi:hypothetical protein